MKISRPVSESTPVMVNGVSLRIGTATQFVRRVKVKSGMIRERHCSCMISTDSAISEMMPKPSIEPVATVRSSGAKMPALTMLTMHDLAVGSGVDVALMRCVPPLALLVLAKAVVRLSPSTRSVSIRATRGPRDD